MPYQVKTTQNEITLSCRLGGFKFKKDQIIDDALGKRLAMYFPNIFILTESTEPVTKVETVNIPVELPVETPVAPIVEPEGTDEEAVVEQEDSGEAVEETVVEEPVEQPVVEEPKKSNAGRKAKKR